MAKFKPYVKTIEGDIVFECPVFEKAQDAVNYIKNKVRKQYVEGGFYIEAVVNVDKVYDVLVEPKASKIVSWRAKERNDDVIVNM